VKKLLLSLMAAIICSCAVAASASNADTEPVVIGSTNFPEQLILANIYAKTLESRGVAVETRLNLGSREIVFPALRAGEVDIMPEYSGALLAYLSNGETDAQTAEEVISGLQQALPDELIMLEPGQAQDKDALVVTQATADEHGLETISDLQGVADDMIVGGPPELESRADGLPGLEETYGLTFQSFRALDAGGPLTVGALENGDIDVARMFSTQGIIDARGWVILQDDRNLVLAQNITPIVRRDVVTATIRATLNAVSAQLTTDDLQRLNHRVDVEKADPAAVAAAWINDHDLFDEQ